MSRNNNHSWPHPTPGIPTYSLLVLPDLVKKTLITFGILAVIVYIGFNIKQIFAPPSIVIFTPNDGYISSNDSTIITGKTEPEVALKINGKVVAPDKLGEFKDTLELEPGLNTITITGSKKYSAVASVTRRIFVSTNQISPTLSQSQN